MTIDELIAALETADGPSRDLDKEIADFTDPDISTYGIKLVARDLLTGMPTGVVSRDLNPSFTASIDVALTLMPDGWVWAAMRSKISGIHVVRISKPAPGSTSPSEGRQSHGSHKMITHALLIAALKARRGT